MLAALGWSGVLQVLAVLGGLVAVATFVVGRLDADRSQASGVYLVITSYRYGVRKASEGPPNHTLFKIHNESDLPVLDVGVGAWHFGRRRRLWRFHPPLRWMTNGRITGQVFPTILPRSTTGEMDIWPADPPPHTERHDTSRPPLVLTFRDGRGRRWVRWPDGKLSRRWPSRG